MTTAHNDGWHLIGFYGDPCTTKRHFSWDLIHQLKDISTFLWCVAGDFNAFFYIHEKEGERTMISLVSGSSIMLSMIGG